MGKKSLFILVCMLVVAMVLGSAFSGILAAESSQTVNSEEIEDDVDSTEGFEDEGDSMEGFEEGDDSTEGFEEGDNSGFADVAVDVESIDTGSVEESFLSFGGFVKEEVGYSYEHENPDFSKIRTTVNLNVDFKLFSDWKAKIVGNGFYDYAYSRIGRDEFTDETLESNESESEVRDFFVEGGLSSWLRVKIGRQIIAWGESEGTQISDMANPRDMRELGMVDIEDARIPVTATKLSVLLGSWEANAVAIHEIRAHKMPPPGSEFDTFQALGANGILVRDEEIPENTEYLVRVFKSFNGGDVSLVWADVYDDVFYLDFYEPSMLSSEKILFTPRHQRINVVGFSGNMVSGSWLLKTEMARKTDKAFALSQSSMMARIFSNLSVPAATFAEDSELIRTWSVKDLLQTMIGLEFSGIDDVSISLEASVETIEDYDDNLMNKEQTGSASLFLTHSALNGTLNTRFILIHFTDNNGDVYRVNVDYDIIDALNISVGMIVYEASSEEGMVYAFRKNDRLFAALKYSF